MQLDTIGATGSLRRDGFAGRWPAILEGLAVLAAMALVLPAFDQLAQIGAGRDQRFAEPGLQASGQPAPVLPAACSAPGLAAGAALNGPGCSAVDAAASEARRTQLNARKSEAMRALLQSAGRQWAVAMALGYTLLVLSRRRWPPLVGVALALAAWALAAWLGRVPWPLVGNRGFQPARLADELWSRPAAFVLWIGAAALLLMLLAWARSAHGPARFPAPARAMSSRLGYPGLVLATGLGALLLLDLSANGSPANRYLALYHQGHLWLGMLVFSVLVFLRGAIGRTLGWVLAVVGEAAHRSAGRVGHTAAATVLLLSAIAAVAAFGLVLANLRQLTSELAKLWLVVGAAWFFFMRASPLAERLARAGPSGTAFWRYVRPMLFVVAVLVAAMLVTRDMGPLLIAGYASGAFLAASAAMWWQQRSGQSVSAFMLAVVLFAVWIVAITVALLQLGSVDSVAAVRLESMAAPFASANDQQALVTWFQRAAPTDGFGIGAVPWCGYLALGRCSGVPGQIHSDYTFTAIVGVFGSAAAWAASLGCAVWLHRLIRHHGRVTRGEPRFVASAGQITNDGQALLSWIAVAWVVLTSCQLAVTVAGNLAVLPLTGVTFPFVSYGMSSLLVNLAFLALCIDVDLTRGHDDG